MLCSENYWFVLHRQYEEICLPFCLVSSPRLIPKLKLSFRWLCLSFLIDKTSTRSPFDKLTEPWPRRFSQLENYIQCYRTTNGVFAGESKYHLCHPTPGSSTQVTPGFRPYSELHRIPKRRIAVNCWNIMWLNLIVAGDRTSDKRSLIVARSMIMFRIPSHTRSHNVVITRSLTILSAKD